MAVKKVSKKVVKKTAKKPTKLRLLLAERKWTTKMLATRVKNISVRTIQAIAAGTRKPSIEVAQRIAKALRSSVDEIFG